MRIKAFRGRQYYCLDGFRHLTKSECDSDDQQTSHVATFQAPCPAASMESCGNVSSPQSDTMHHLMRKHLSHGC